MQALQVFIFSNTTSTIEWYPVIWLPRVLNVYKFPPLLGQLFSCFEYVIEYKPAFLFFSIFFILFSLWLLNITIKICQTNVY